MWQQYYYFAITFDSHSIKEEMMHRKFNGTLLTPRNNDKLNLSKQVIA